MGEPFPPHTRLGWNCQAWKAMRNPLKRNLEKSSTELKSFWPQGDTSVLLKLGTGRAGLRGRERGESSPRWMETPRPEREPRTSPELIGSTAGLDGEVWAKSTWGLTYGEPVCWRNSSPGPQDLTGAFQAQISSQSQNRTHFTAELCHSHFELTWICPLFVPDLRSQWGLRIWDWPFLPDHDPPLATDSLIFTLTRGWD